MKLPNFIIGGAQTAGTTALWDYLNLHPEIQMPETKEINFFSFEYHKGINYYSKLFECLDTNCVVGEASPQYITDEIYAKRIKKHTPEIKLIFILRDPIKRAYSNYHYNIQRHLQNPDLSFEKSIREDDGYERYI